MAKVYVMDFDGGTAANYDAVMVDMDLRGIAPPGARFHTAGPAPTGWRVIDCWDDPAAFDRFAEERIGPLTAKHGLRPPRTQTLDVDGDLTGPDDTPEVTMHIVLPGLDRAAFRALDEQVVVGGEVPGGLLRHVNGPHPDGWYVVDLWVSEAKRTAFIEQRVMPAATSAPLSGPPRIELLPVHGSILAPAHART